MEEVIIRFADGTEITADRNGSAFITDERPAFPEDLSLVEVSGSEPMAFHNARAIECAAIDGRYWFSFEEIPASEKESLQVEQNTANIDYIAMMTDVELPEEV